MTNPRSIYWAQALDDLATSVIWQDGVPVPDADTARRQELVAIVSNVTAGSEPVPLPGGANCWFARAGRDTALVVEVPRLERDTLDRPTLLTIYEQLTDNADSQIIGSKVRSAIDELRSSGVTAELAETFDETIAKTVEMNRRPGCIGRLPFRKIRRDET
jgi:hypothetical protein